MKDLQVEFKEETKKDVLTSDDYGGYYYSDEYVEWLEKRVIKLCTIPHVSQQRELLIDFCEVYADGKFEDPDDTEGIVDWYLRVKDN